MHTGNTGNIEFLSLDNYNYGKIGVVSGTSLIGGDVYGLGYSSNTNDVFTPVLNWTSNGRLYGTALHNNSGAVTGTTNQYIASGTYTPTLADVSNTSARTAYQGQWMRVGNVVTVSGTLDLMATLISTATRVSITLPIASTFTTSYQCSGTAGDALHDIGGAIASDSSSKAILSFSTLVAGGTNTFNYIFTYEVL